MVFLWISKGSPGGVLAHLPMLLQVFLPDFFDQKTSRVFVEIFKEFVCNSPTDCFQKCSFIFTIILSKIFPGILMGIFIKILPKYSTKINWELPAIFFFAFFLELKQEFHRNYGKIYSGIQSAQFD